MLTVVKQNRHKYAFKKSFLSHTFSSLTEKIFVKNTHKQFSHVIVL